MESREIPSSHISTYIYEYIHIYPLKVSNTVGIAQGKYLTSPNTAILTEERVSPIHLRRGAAAWHWRGIFAGASRPCPLCGHLVIHPVGCVCILYSMLIFMIRTLKLKRNLLRDFEDSAWQRQPYRTSEISSKTCKRHYTTLPTTRLPQRTMWSISVPPN